MKTLLLRSTLLCFALLVAGTSSAQDRPRTIHQERSLYRNILVTEDNVRRCMRFTVAELDGQNQSCRFLHDYDKLVFPYAKMVLSSTLVQDNPKRILIVGLGGGTLVHTYSTLFPAAQIVIAEIDPAVTKVAQTYFDFKTTDKISVAEEDGRIYVKRAGLKGDKFDLVVLDAFNGDYIPEHLMTAEFLEEVKKLLPPTGMLVANTFSSSRLYSAESQTYAKVYGKFFNLRMANSGNRIIVASLQPLPDAATLQQRASAMGDRLVKFDIDIKTMVQYLKSDVDWDTTEKVLTDQYSPVNQLNR
ncbi:MAG TPA: fused MFS/spermidine synthase [Candidatus Acidoferrum sp.]|nr:fused MFS/spermidine synthase [Candidatus Acidoferrum sp.]